MSNPITQTKDPFLGKLFEDPDEREDRIQSSIARSKLKKRQRLNSGTSNQSKERSSLADSSSKYLSSRIDCSNSDLLKRFQDDLSRKDL